MIFCMRVPFYKSKKRARRFFRKKSGSLIIHENVSILDLPKGKGPIRSPLYVCLSVCLYVCMYVTTAQP